VNRVLQEILDTGRFPSPSGGSVQVHSAVSRQEAELLQQIVRKVGSLVSLEIGLAYGVSALAICDALVRRPGTRHVVIDPEQSKEDEWAGLGLYNLRSAGFGDLVEFMEMPSAEALPRLLSQGLQVDFALIDGWHSFDQVMVDFFYVDRLLRVGGVVVLDDAHMPGVRKACRYIVTNRPYSVLRHTGSPGRRSLLKRLIVEATLRVAGASQRVRRAVRAGLLRGDEELGLAGTCIAFRKEDSYVTPWDSYHDF